MRPVSSALPSPEEPQPVVYTYVSAGDASGSDVGAYGQSYLFAEYLKTQCGVSVFRSVLNHWRGAEDPSLLTAAEAIKAQLTAEQRDALSALCAYTDPVTDQLGSEANVLLSKFGLAFRLAILLQQDEGLYAIGKEQPEMPVYNGSGRKIDGGGAILIACGGSFVIPADADSGLVFVGLRDGTITEVYTVPEPEEGFYVLAAEFNGAWMAIPAAPSGSGIITPIEICAPENGSFAAKDVKDAIFQVTRQNDGFRIACDQSDGAYALGRTEKNQQNLTIEAVGTPFSWTHFADGADRLQADGTGGRAILYGSYQKGFGYFPSGYFENAAFAKVRMIRVRIRKGDANLDGRITSADAAMILRGVVGLSYLKAPMRAAADLDADGIASSTDAVRVLRMIVNLEPEPEDDITQ